MLRLGTTKANCRQLIQEAGADDLFFLKRNQPHALAKATLPDWQLRNVRCPGSFIAFLARPRG